MEKTWLKDAWNGLEVTVTDSDSDSSDCVAVDKPKTPSQPKDNDKSAQLQSNRKEEVKKPPDSRKMSPSKGLTNGNEQICNAPEVKKRQTGLFEWIRSKTTKVVIDQERTELEDEQTDAILEVTFEGSNGEETGRKAGGKSNEAGEESDKALDEVLGSPAKPDPSKFGKVYSGKKATPAKQSPNSRLRSPHHNRVSRETSPVAGPSWRRTPVKSMPEKSSFDLALPRNADPVVVIQRQALFLGQFLGVCF